MGYELVVTEKPNAAKKIAEALDNGKPIKESNNGVPYYKVTHKDKDIVVACAVGHLYGLTEKEKSGWHYPVFDIEWKPTADTNKNSAFTKKYLTTIKKLAKEASEFTVACDYDQEGSVIGMNVIIHACKKKDANRMKFSTLTKDELIKSYEGKDKTLDWPQAKAGETRHFLDFYNGINYSRALTLAIKTTGSFKLMSTGRVQGPALKLIVDKEKEIKAFKPEPYWQISLDGSIASKGIEAWHKKDKIWDESQAKEIMHKLDGATSAEIADVTTKQFSQAPPTPFDLTSLQLEAYKTLRIPPKRTLEVCQELYLSGAISYPRTSSQKLPESIGYKTILKALQKREHYADLAGKLLAKGTLKPNEGKKSDPAHPAIYPTGQEPTTHEDQLLKVYDLIVKRFFATFCEPAKRQTVTLSIECKKEPFVCKGTTTVEAGWHDFYRPYVMLDEQELPPASKGDTVDVSKITKHDKETQPPKRFTPASIVKELEKRNLGTKATRSEIVDTLFKRGYVDGKSIEATELGIRTCDTLAKYAPKIVDEELTRHFEEGMDLIREGKSTPDKVLKDAQEKLTAVLKDFKSHETAIGKELSKANIETRNELTTVGKCMKCGEGDLQIRKGRFGGFIACNKYPKCKTTFSLPKGALIKPAKKECEKCNYPVLLVIKAKKKPQEICLNQDCETKTVESDEEKKLIGTACPTCGKGKLVERKSLYGAFLGCDQYPKCKYSPSRKS